MSNPYIESTTVLSDYYTGPVDVKHNKSCGAKKKDYTGLVHVHV